MFNVWNTAFHIATVTILRPRESVQTVLEQNPSSQVVKLFLLLTFTTLAFSESVRGLIVGDHGLVLDIGQTLLFMGTYFLVVLTGSRLLLVQNPQRGLDENLLTLGAIAIPVMFWAILRTLEMIAFLVFPPPSFFIGIAKWVILGWIGGHTLCLLNADTEGENGFWKNTFLFVGLNMIGMVLGLTWIL